LLSYAKSFKLYSEAAVAGNRFAAEKLAVLYEHGLGTKRDLVEASRWYLRAASQGSEEAKDNAERLHLVLDHAQWETAQREAAMGGGKP
ncbi:MAG: hypothetical protein ACREKE_06780, partial [bacterium]